MKKKMMFIVLSCVLGANIFAAAGEQRRLSYKEARPQILEYFRPLSNEEVRNFLFDNDRITQIGSIRLKHKLTDEQKEELFQSKLEEGDLFVSYFGNISEYTFAPEGVVTWPGEFDDSDASGLMPAAGDLPFNAVSVPDVPRGDNWGAKTVSDIDDAFADLED